MTILVEELTTETLEATFDGCRIMCEPTCNDIVVIEPRIVSWKGWNVEHHWHWDNVGYVGIINGTKLTILDPVDGQEIRYITQEHVADQCICGVGVTLDIWQAVARGV